MIREGGGESPLPSKYGKPRILGAKRQRKIVESTHREPLMTKSTTGRPPGQAAIKAASARAAVVAVEALASVAADPGVPAVDRVAAAAKLLEHATTDHSQAKAQ